MATIVVATMVLSAFLSGIVTIAMPAPARLSTLATTAWRNPTFATIQLSLKPILMRSVIRLVTLLLNIPSPPVAPLMPSATSLPQ
jgi:hypothetical protein